MVKIYKRNCNYCKKYYKGYGKSFCSLKCASISSPKCFKKGQKAPNWNGFKKGVKPWSKYLTGKDFLEHFKEGKTWNKGLTKETDERVRKNVEKLKKTLDDHPEIRKIAGKKISETRKRLFRKGELKVSEANKRQAKELGLRPKSESHRRKISESNKIAFQRPKTKEKMRIANSGKKNPRYGVIVTEQTRKRMRESHPDISGKNNPMYGKPKTKKWKEMRAKLILPKKDTKIEVKIQNFLKQLQIPFFTHQYMKIEHGYQCDILIPAMNLVIECDGDFIHCNPAIYPPDFRRFPNSNLDKPASVIWEIDHIRTSELLSAGFKVLRLWGSEIKKMELNDFKKFL